MKIEREVMLTPKDVNKVQAAFPTSVDGFVPAYASIPDEFKESSHWAAQLFSRLFYQGGSLEKLKHKPGVDRAKAIAHIRYVMGSWEPKHEHKMAGVAYLFDQWFEKPDQATFS